MSFFKLSVVVPALVLLGIAVIVLRFAVSTVIALQFSPLALLLATICFITSCLLIDRAVHALVFETL